MKRIRSGRGLGDNIYLLNIVTHLVGKRKELEVCTDFPELFEHLPVQIDKFGRHNIDIISHYNQNRYDKDHHQWEDCCYKAKLNPKDVRYGLDWKVKGDLKLPKPFVFVALPRQPMNRKDGFGIELLPDCRVIDQILDRLQEKYYTVQVGKGRPLYNLENIDYDLSNKTSITDLMDIASQAEVFVGQVSFIIPLAESFDKPLIAVWSRKGLDSEERFVNHIKPEKILSKPTSHYVIDDWSDDRIAETVKLC